MNLLLDTHVLLWWLDDDPSLSEKARASISDGHNLVFVSAPVVWEIQIKHALGKLIIPSDFHQVLETQPFEMLAITVAYAYAIAHLPNHHRDPFDRMLIAQAKLERLTIVTRDQVFSKYQVPIIKA
jgi:PIN domain nuclease of toxin-antitoxin system